MERGIVYILRKDFTMNNQFKNMMLVMVVAVSATSTVRADSAAVNHGYLKAGYDFVVAKASAVANATVNIAVAAKDGVVDAGKATAHAVCNPVETTTAAKNAVVNAGEVVVHAVCHPTETATQVVTTITENPATTAAVVAGAVLAYIAYIRYNTQEEAPSA